MKTAGKLRCNIMAIAKDYDRVSQPLFSLQVSRLGIVSGCPRGPSRGVSSFHTEAPGTPGAFFIVLVSVGDDFSEPEIDHFVMAITAAEAVQGVHFTPEMEGFDAGPRDNQ